MRFFMWAFWLAVALACGSEAGSSAEQARAGGVKVRPETVSVPVGGRAQFTSTPVSTAVTWSVREAGGGSVTQAGAYTAPGSAGTFHVVATSQADAAVSGEATVTVVSPVQIVATTPVDTDACRAVQLQATVTGSSDTGVLWTVVDPACGTVTAAGVFTSARGNGTDCAVQAQAHADPSRVAIVVVNYHERVLGVAVVPATANVPTYGTQPFAANVTTTCGTFPAGS